jgi:hypothetical protein
MNRAVIAPIVAVLSIIAQLFFHVQIPDDVQAQLVTGIINIAAIGYTIYGIIKKQGQSNAQTEDPKSLINYGYIPSPPDHRDYIYGQKVDMSQELSDEFFLPDEAPKFMSVGVCKINGTLVFFISNSAGKNVNT